MSYIYEAVCLQFEFAAISVSGITSAICVRIDQSFKLGTCIYTRMQFRQGVYRYLYAPCFRLGNSSLDTASGTYTNNSMI